MPNAGIHGTRSTIWKSADEESKRSQMASVTAKTASDMTSASQRIALSRLPSLLGTSRSRIAPARGNAQDRVSNMSQPQVVGEDGDDADEYRAGVGLHRSGLQPPQQRRAAVDDGCRAVHRAVDDLYIEAAPQAFLRRDANRLHDGRVVDLVHVVLVQQEPMHGC